MRSPLMLDLFNATTSGVMAVEPGAWSRLVGVLETEAHGPVAESEIRARLGAVTPARPGSPAGPSIAGVPVSGLLFKRKTLLGSIMGWTSLDEIVAAVEAAGADPQILTICLLIDSPGGTTDGLPEAADAIAAVARRKNIVALVDGLGCSAAYWVAAGANEIVATPSSQVGSIGVLMVHQETSRMDERLGITSTVMTAGRGKGEGSPLRPLTPEDRAAIQRRLDVTYSMFVGSVAAGRHTTPEAVRTGPAGRVLVAVDALAAGLVDRIATTRETLGRLVGAAAGRGRLVAGPDLDTLRLRARAAELGVAPGVEVRRRRLRLAESQAPDIETLRLRARAAELS